MTHKYDLPIMALLALALFLSSCAAPMIPGDVLPMGTGSALYVFQEAVSRSAGTMILSGPVNGGTGYLFIRAYQGWFGSVGVTINGGGDGACLEQLLNISGNAMTPDTLEGLVDTAKSVGWKEISPLSLPPWMRMVSGIIRATYNAQQLSTGWLMIIPADAFTFPDSIVPQQAQN